jgi:hypothetical protein
VVVLPQGSLLAPAIYIFSIRFIPAGIAKILFE